MQQRTGTFKENFSKNTFYRFLNSAKTNRLRFTSLLAADIVNRDLKELTDEKRTNVFIVDDTLFERSGCKKTELGSRVFDHTDMTYKKGYRMLTLSWSDGNTLISVNSCLLASAKESNVIGQIRNFDKRNMDVIAMIKKSSRIRYEYRGEQLNIKEIYSRNKKRRGRSKYLLSVDIILGKGDPVPEKIVCVRNKANRKDWLAFVCTDPELSKEEIIRIYGKRWQIEVFFKTCKSVLNLIGECHSLSYDALTAHTAIVFTGYMLLALEQRRNED